MRRIKEIPKEDRPREKFLKRGPSALSNVELMALILNKGSKKKDVLALSKEVLEVIEKDPENVKIEELTKIEGIGKVKAIQIVACLTLAKRLLIKEGTPITKTSQLFHMNMDLAHERQECVALITVDGAGKFIKRRILSRGTANRALIHPREVFYHAIGDGAAAIFIVHNHPSGDLTPSQEDIDFTKRLLEASRIMGIPLLDHVIISKKGFFSFKEKGLMDVGSHSENG